MLKPFQIILELLEFGLQALFVYVLAIIICVGFIVLAIVKHKEDEPVIVYKDRIIKEYIPASSKTTEQECTKIAGCRVNSETGEIEY